MKYRWINFYLKKAHQHSVPLILFLPGFTGFYRVLLGFTGFYRVFLGFTGFYRVLPGFTGFYWVFPGFPGDLDDWAKNKQLDIMCRTWFE